jgi:hypothetical protein
LHRELQSQLAYSVSAMAPFEERKTRERQRANLQHVGSSDPAGPNDVGRAAEKLVEKAGDEYPHSKVSA